MDRHPLGTPFHLPAWKNTIEDGFGYQPYYMAAEEDGAVRGVLPLFLVRNAIVGKVLISTPFAVYGGILADGDEARQALLEATNRLGNELGVDHIELRNRQESQCSGLPRISRYATFTFPSADDPENLLAAIPKKARNMVRKVLKLPYTVRTLERGLGRFLELYTKNLRRLGTPSFPEGHFHRLREHFGSMVDVREILLEDKVVAASFNFLYKGQMHTYYAASDQDFLQQSPNNYMYFDHLLWAGKNGYPVFDFGRSKFNTGPFEFKKHWGAQMEELPYEIILVKRKEVPNFTPQNPKFEMAIKVWQQLPLPVTRWLGPRLVGLFP